MQRLCITFKNGFKEVHFLVRLSVALPLCAYLFRMFKRGKGLLMMIAKTTNAAAEKQLLLLRKCRRKIHEHPT